MNPLDLITNPLGQFLNFIYNTLAFHSYGLAIIIFTLVIKIVLLPLSIKQYRSMARMQEVQPQIQEIQKRYKNDKEKLNQELMRVYQENKVNPAGGCAPLLIQMPILISLYWVISSPLQYMLKLPKNIIYGNLENGKVVSNGLVQLFNITGKSNVEITVINSFKSDVASKLLDAGTISKIQDIGRGLVSLKFGSFPGFNLGIIPTWHLDTLLSNPQYLALIIIPILAAVTTYISIKFSAAQTSQNADNPMQGGMTFAMPLVTTFFTFSVPAGLGLYWIISNLVQIFQQMYMNKYIIKKKEVVIK